MLQVRSAYTQVWFFCPRQRLLQPQQPEKPPRPRLPTFVSIPKQHLPKPEALLQQCRRGFFLSQNALASFHRRALRLSPKGLHIDVFRLPRQQRGRPGVLSGANLSVQERKCISISHARRLSFPGQNQVSGFDSSSICYRRGLRE